MQELEWLSSHPREAERYSGKWVAVTNRGIAASGGFVSEVESILKRKNIALDKVMLMKIPRKDEEMSIL